MTEPASIPRLSIPEDVVPADDWPDRLGESEAERIARLGAKARAKQRVWKSNLPARYADATLEGLDADQHPDRLRAWLDRGIPNLILRSDHTGPGKSHAAYALGREAMGRGIFTASWSMIGLNDAMRPGADPTAYATACSCALLIVDDVGRESLSPWTLERFQGILDTRYGDRLRTVVTTNLSGQAFLDRYGDPIVDRLTDESWTLPFTGPNRRKPAPW